MVMFNMLNMVVLLVAANRVLRGDYRKLTANEAGSLEYYRDFGGLDKSLL